MADLFDDIEAHHQANGTVEDKPKSSVKGKKEGPAGERKQSKPVEKQTTMSSGDATTRPNEKKKKKKKKQQEGDNDGNKRVEGSKEMEKEKEDQKPVG